METVKLSIDEEPVELALWDIRGIDYDPTWLNDAHVALVCFSVNIGSTDSKGKHLGRVSVIRSAHTYTHVHTCINHMSSC